MKIQPLKVGKWLLTLVVSGALVEVLKLPGRLLVEKCPSVAEWVLAIFLAEILVLIFCAGLQAIGQFLSYKKQKQEEGMHKQKIDKCKQILESLKNDDARKEELEIVKTKLALARIGNRF